jgi:hypothetical protein
MSNKTIIRETLEELRDPELDQEYRERLVTAALAELDREEGLVDEPYRIEKPHENNIGHWLRGPGIRDTIFLDGHAASLAVNIANKALHYGRSLQSPPAPVSYAMSRDHSALYDLLVAGGETIRTFGEDGRVLGWIGQATVNNWGKMNRDSFIAECQRLSLEFVAPVDLSEIVEDLVSAAIDTYIKHENIDWQSPPPNYLNELRKMMSARFSAVTAKHRKP